MAGDDRIRPSPDDQKFCVSELLLVDYKLHLSPASQTKQVAWQSQVEIFHCK